MRMPKEEFGKVSGFVEAQRISHFFYGKRTVCQQTFGFEYATTVYIRFWGDAERLFYSGRQRFFVNAQSVQIVAHAVQMGMICFNFPTETLQYLMGVAMRRTYSSVRFQQEDTQIVAGNDYCKWSCGFCISA